MMYCWCSFQEKKTSCIYTELHRHSSRYCCRRHCAAMCYEWKHGCDFSKPTHIRIRVIIFLVIIKDLQQLCTAGKGTAGYRGIDEASGAS